MKKNLRCVWIALCCIVVLGDVFFVVTCNRVKKEEKQNSVFLNYENTDGEIN